jgi:hypothetical protein
MGTTAGTDPGGVQGVPLAARAEHKHNGIHRPTIVDPRVVTAQRMRFARREQRFDLGPKLIGDLPRPARFLFFHFVPPAAGLSYRRTVLFLCLSHLLG